MVATTALESTPPERNAPSGTSEIMRSRTDSSRRRFSSSQASSSVIGLASVKRTSQYSTGSGTGWPRLTVSVCAGRQLLRAGEDRARLGHVAEREVLLDRAGIDLAAEPGMHQQRLELGAEEQRAVGQHRVVQRLHAQPVARHEQRLAVPVVEREGEHAAEAVDAALAPRLPGVDDHLGVAAGVEHVARAPAAPGSVPGSCRSRR